MKWRRKTTNPCALLRWGLSIGITEISVEFYADLRTFSDWHYVVSCFNVILWIENISHLKKPKQKWWLFQWLVSHPSSSYFLSCQVLPELFAGVFASTETSLCCMSGWARPLDQSCWARGPHPVICGILQGMWSSGVSNDSAKDKWALLVLCELDWITTMFNHWEWRF